jgi:hypothetical protein
MPMAERNRATAPNATASSIGNRRLTSDSSTRSCIVRTLYSGTSGSMAAISRRMALATVSAGRLVRATMQNVGALACVIGK